MLCWGFRPSPAYPKPRRLDSQARHPFLLPPCSEQMEGVGGSIVDLSVLQRDRPLCRAGFGAFKGQVQRPKKEGLISSRFFSDPEDPFFSESPQPTALRSRCPALGPVALEAATGGCHGSADPRDHEGPTPAVGVGGPASFLANPEYLQGSRSITPLSSEPLSSRPAGMLTVLRPGPFGPVSQPLPSRFLLPFQNLSPRFLHLSLPVSQATSSQFPLLDPPLLSSS